MPCVAGVMPNRVRAGRAPFSPINAWTVPGRTASRTPSSATTPGNSFRTSFNSSRNGNVETVGPERVIVASIAPTFIRYLAVKSL